MEGYTQRQVKQLQTLAHRRGPFELACQTCWVFGTFQARLEARGFLKAHKGHETRLAVPGPEGKGIERV